MAFDGQGSRSAGNPINLGGMSMPELIDLLISVANEIELRAMEMS